MRTPEEILLRIAALKDDDFFGFESNDLIGYLKFEHARSWLKEDADGAKWDEQYKPPTEENLKKEIKEYLPFAMEKAENHRGLSAGRSVAHLRSWFWLLGDDEMSAFIDDEDNYTYYGAPILKKTAEKLGISFPDTGGLANMAKGEECRPGCSEGCNS